MLKADRGGRLPYCVHPSSVILPSMWAAVADRLPPRPEGLGREREGSRVVGEDRLEAPPALAPRLAAGAGGGRARVLGRLDVCRAGPAGETGHRHGQPAGGVLGVRATVRGVL